MNAVLAARVKICGVRSIADAILCVGAGADAIGLNFVGESPRRVNEDDARRIVDAVGSRALVVGVVANMTKDRMRALRDSVGLGCLQLHGEETPETLATLLPHAYKAIRVRDASDVARAGSYAGEHILVDAKVDGALGGTGATFDWSLVARLAGERKLTLAGGLTPDNVAEAIRVVSPYCVDVASGVERSPREAPGVKDEALVRAFVSRAKRV